MKKILLTFLTVTLVLLPLMAMGQQPVTINGVVYDDVGNPLPGANVFIQDTQYGAAADVHGEFNFEVPRELALGQEVVLMAQFIGFRSRSIKITLSPGTITQNFELAPDVLELESVVVTGFGTSLIKEKLGVSISKVKPQLLVRSNESNVVEALAGKAAGLQVTQTSGDPGTNSYIRIRGGSSIDRGTQPLFVVDGVPISNRTDYTIGYNGGTETSNRASDLNNEDIESVEILKGAAASAIYGSRASNGVVMITTKSGRPGKTNISYKFNVGASQQSRFYPVQRWFGQGSKGAFKKNYSRSWGRPLNVPDAPWFDSSKPIDTVYDHGREITGTGWQNENNLTVSGGNQLTTFFFSFGRLYQKGHWKAGSDYQRYTARLKATQVISDKLKVTANIAYANTNANYLQRGDNAIGLQLGTLRTPPEFNNLPYIDPETGFHRSYRYSDAKVLKKTRKFDNPFFAMYEDQNPRDIGRLYGYLKGEYDLLDWVKVNYTLGSDYSSDEAMYLNPPSGSREDGRGVIRKTNFTYHEIDGNLVVTVQGDKFLHNYKNIDATLMFGHNINRREYHRLQTQGIDMGVPGFNQLDNTVSTNLSTNEYQWLIHTEGLFGQATIDLYDQLYLTAALRNDGSSTFGKSQKRHWYPKFSAAWEFTKLTEVPYLNFGKLRVAYGEAGVQPGVYTTVSGFSSGGKGFGLFTSTGLNPTYRGKSGYYSSSTLGNDDVKPELTKEFEVGGNLAFWDSRIGLDVTYYNAKSTDVLFDLNVVPSTGSFSQTRNAATLRNRGWEATLDLVPIRKHNFTWDLGLIYARNRNMVLDMSGASWERVGRWAYAGKGHELGEMRLLTWVRFGRKDLNDGRGEFLDVDGDGVGEYIDEYYAGQWKAGDVYIPESGYPIMSSEPMWSGLTSNPRWTGSLRTEFTLFNNLSISAFFESVQGHYIMNHGAGALYSYGTHAGTADRWVEGFSTEADMKPIPLMGKFGSGPNGRNDVKGIGPGATDGVGKPVKLTESWYRSAGAGFQGDGFQFTEDASYIKLREISISYRLHNDFIRRLGLSDVTFRLSGRNLQTWTDYTGFDPETNRRQATGQRDSDYFNQPQTRTYNLTIYVNY
ncbi:MAG: SusC/RagA family TonB-linked outer membrane protein [bacterium]